MINAELVYVSGAFMVSSCFSCVMFHGGSRAR